MKDIILLLCFVSFFASCEPEEAAGVAQNNYFDLSEFVQSRIDDNPIYPSVNRRVIIENRKEDRNLGEYDMTEALSFLNQFNINRPRWSDKYKEEENGEVKTYKAVDEEMKIRMMQVKRSAGEVVEITIDFKSETLISKSDKHIIYKPGSLLSIETVSDPLLGEGKRTKVVWEY